MHPNKPTLIATVLYALTAGEKSEKRPLYTELKASEQAPFIAASDFLGAYCIGQQAQSIDRTKFAASFKQAVEDTPVAVIPADLAVGVFLNLHLILS